MLTGRPAYARSPCLVFLAGWAAQARILAVVPEAIRREGSVLAQEAYEAIRAEFGPRDSRLRSSIRRLFGRSRPSKVTPTVPT